MDDLMLPPLPPRAATMGDVPVYDADQMREYARKAVEAERQRCSQLATLCSWGVTGAENALRVAALDESIRDGRPLD